MSEAECPTCSRTFDAEQHMKIHHVRTHGESVVDWVTKEFVCEWCNEQFSRKVHVDESRQFCSHSCAAKAQSQRNGDRVYEIHGRAPSTREKALERDGYTCQRCGVGVVEGHRKSQKSAEVHHLIPRAASGPDAPQNLVTLCLRCHKEAHRDMKQIHEHHPQLLEELREVVCEDGDRE